MDEPKIDQPKVVRPVDVSPVTPTNKALYEAGKSLLIDSITTTREFCKFMIGTSMGAIPIYLALMKFLLPESYTPTLGESFLALIAPLLFLTAGVVFVFGYFPHRGIASLDLPEEIESERRSTVARRYRLAVSGFTLFCAAVVFSLFMSVSFLRMKGKGELDGPANGSQPIRSETNRTSSAVGSRR